MLCRASRNPERFGRWGWPILCQCVGVSYSAPRTPKIHMQAGAEPVPLAFADFSNPQATRLKGVAVYTFRHQDDALWHGSQFRTDCRNFIQIAFGRNNELELMRIVAH